MRSRIIGTLGLAAGLLTPRPVGGEEALRLSLPLDCRPGRTCFIQNYVDVDPGPGTSDFACGSATYDGHTGVDFRVLSAAAARKGVRVLAAADGTVKGVRNVMPDVLARNGARGLQGKECGNGVLLEHGGGWETQYCHMLKGSVRVRPGEHVARGQQLGDVGYSGLAQFAHVHLSVRHDGKVIDPFTGKEPDGSCEREARSPQGLWDKEAAEAFPYANGEIIEVGFTSKAPSWIALETDHEAYEPVNPGSEQLLSFARIANARGGDRVRITITGPAGLDVQGVADPLDRNKAVYLSYVGKRRTGAPWAPGHYESLAELIRDGSVISRKRASYEIR